MKENQYNFTIIYKELERLSKEPEIELAFNDMKEHEEIRALREIALEIQTAPQIYFAST